MKATSISPAIISIETPVDQSLPANRKEELLRLIEKHRPAQLIPQISIPRIRTKL